MHKEQYIEIELNKVTLSVNTPIYSSIAATTLYPRGTEQYNAKCNYNYNAHATACLLYYVP